MAKKENKITSSKLLVTILIVVSIVSIFIIFSKKANNSSQQLRPSLSQQGQLKSHTSEDLKISFTYPKDWYIYDKNFDVFITSYFTNHNEGKKPEHNQIEVGISNPGGCHEDVEENLIDPACGEGGSKVKPNKIIVKEVNQKQSGSFYKYIVEYPSGEKQTFYFFKSGDKILQISKEPDSSQFEKEFEEIVNSISFLE